MIQEYISVLVVCRPSYVHRVESPKSKCGMIDKPMFCIIPPIIHILGFKAQTPMHQSILRTPTETKRRMWQKSKGNHNHWRTAAKI